MVIFSKIHGLILYVLRRVLVLVEGLLALRLILRFLLASPDAWVVKILYQVTQVIIWPFNFIFPDVSLGGHLVDIIAISAMVGYVIIFFIIQWFLNFLWRE